ncbi:MAG: hypothetical protein U0821_26800 [Chloroflexota bacterium]
MTADPVGIRLRPMGIGEILDESLRLYRRHFVAFFVTIAVSGVPLTLMTALSGLLLGTESSGTFGSRTSTAIGTRDVGVIAIIVVAGVAWALLTFLGSLAATKLAVDLALGKSSTVRSAYGMAIRKFVPALAATILMSLATTALSLTCIGIPFAIYLGAGWALYSVANLMESAGPIAALRRSATLVRGYRWRIILCFFLVSALVSVLTNIPQSLTSVLVMLLTSVFKSYWVGVAGHITGAVVGGLTFSLFGALGSIVDGILYLDLRVRKEALDLQIQLERLPPV